MLQAFNADLFWVLGFLWVLPDEVITMPRLGTINTHGGILPQYRGPNPASWCFRNDDGVQDRPAVHRMTSVVDGGPILAQGTCAYGDDDDFQSISPRWAGIIPGLIPRALERILAGDPGDPQDERRAGYAGFFESEWREIDWARPSRAIHNQVRSWVGLRGVPLGAFGEIDGVRRLITKTQLMPGTPVPDVEPGRVIERDEETVVIQTGDGPLRVVRWQAGDGES
jgi:methionyl-tRNA formyltransferase